MRWASMWYAVGSEGYFLALLDILSATKPPHRVSFDSLFKRLTQLVRLFSQSLLVEILNSSSPSTESAVYLLENLAHANHPLISQHLRVHHQSAIFLDTLGRQLRCRELTLVRIVLSIIQTAHPSGTRSQGAFPRPSDLRELIVCHTKLVLQYPGFLHLPIGQYSLLKLRLETLDRLVSAQTVSDEMDQRTRLPAASGPRCQTV